MVRLLRSRSLWLCLLADQSARSAVFLLIAQPSASASGEKLTFPPDHKLRNAEPEGRRHFDVGKFVSEEMGEGAEVVGLTWFVVEAEK